MSDESSKVVELDSAWRRILRRGLRQLEQGAHGDALASFERALAEAPDEPQVLLAAGREYLRQGQHGRAEALLRRALVLQPDSLTALAGLARVLGLHLQRPEEALALINQGLAQTEAEGPLQVVRGEVLLEQGAWLEAREAFRRALEGELSDSVARVGLARTYNVEGIVLSEQGAYEPAVFAFKRAADLDPLWSAPWVNLGVVFGRLGKHSRALEAYGTALERDPQNPVAYFNLGTVQHELGQLPAAVRSFEDLFLLAPDYPHVRGALANVLGEMGELDRAIALFLEELESEPRCVSCWTSLGLAYLCAGNPERGEECLRHALNLDPAHYNAIHRLASLYAAQKRYDEAEQVLLQAFALDPQRTSALVAQDRQFQGLPGLDRFSFVH